MVMWKDMNMPPKVESTCHPMEMTSLKVVCPPQFILMKRFGGISNLLTLIIRFTRFLLHAYVLISIQERRLRVQLPA